MKVQGPVRFLTCPVWLLDVLPLIFNVFWSFSFEPAFSQLIYHMLAITHREATNGDETKICADHVKTRNIALGHETLLSLFLRETN